MDDSVFKDLQAQLAEANAEFNKAKEVLSPLEDEEKKAIAAEHMLKQQFEQQMKEMAARKAAIRQEKYEKYKAQQAAEQKISSLQNQIDSIKAKEEAAAKAKALQEYEEKQYKALEERFDLATIGAPWREFAKDHQIQAGHKMVMDRYVILADPMGLGKTLSAIVTTEMAEKSTKHVTKDEPFLGELKSIYVPDFWVYTQKAVDAAYMGEWPFDQSHYKMRLKYDEDGHLTVNGTELAAGKQAFYLPHIDARRAMKDHGYIEYVPAHYEDQVVNAITRPVGRKVLYLCPSPLLRNVLREWRKWVPHRSATFIGGMSKAERKFALEHITKVDEFVIICNYEAWRRDKNLLQSLVDLKFDTIIIDEAHNIKDMNTSAYKGVEFIVNGHRPEFIFPMTGTPILNRPQELFPLLHLVDPERFTFEQDYLYTYCEEYIPDPDNHPDVTRWRFKPGGLEKLMQKISKNILRRTREQAGIKLPGKDIVYHELELDTEKYPMQSKAREHMKKYMTIVLDETKALQATAIVAMITRLRQIETWPAGIVQYKSITDPMTGKRSVLKDPETGKKIVELELGPEFAESQKIDYIIRFEDGEWEGIIPDSVEDERMVVFSQFKEPLQEIKRRVEQMGYRAAVFDGDTPQKLRDEIIVDFDRSLTPNRADSKWDVLLCNYKAGGVGLNLTAATNLTTLDEEWNPGKRDQALDRVYRMGQTEDVTINIIRTKDTIDTWMADLIDQKEAVVGGFESAVVTFDSLKNALDSGLL